MTDRATQTPPDAPERRRLPPAERRRQIVEGAVTFFADVGLDGTTRDLARRLGITQSLLFNYFSNKAEILEAVYEHVYLDRLSDDWPHFLTDRSHPLRARILTFYREYSRLIFEYNWMRIFMFSGLAGAELNRRYLHHLGTVILRPLLEELHASAPGPALPQMEDIWNLHGGIVYIGIRRHIYQMPTPEDPTEAIERAVDRFLGSYGLG
ncbi:DNA-binding transcriptional regulator, AcrR family [Salinihabitans flavidus]|uniref:DNA-binding transcriptional regulator, AcrR family n=1 Tax=Salinihabitans flavidus TaxID=569882 RepID=A0A1H8RCC5_9RHOB|nr:TetR/AcrR family transcriptional regulator [Salinihabitans flavidus]SEO63643.1 DNA-binding transcriptional regulator, AcrR family [Salinihabitans flavidus]